MKKEALLFECYLLEGGFIGRLEFHDTAVGNEPIGSRVVVFLYSVGLCCRLPKLFLALLSLSQFRTRIYLILMLLKYLIKKSLC